MAEEESNIHSTDMNWEAPEGAGVAIYNNMALMALIKLKAPPFNASNTWSVFHHQLDPSSNPSSLIKQPRSWEIILEIFLILGDSNSFHPL